MANFQNLQNILDMDFTEMRAIPGAGGMRATDAAIRLFVNNLVSFYLQFEADPTKEQLRTYVMYMEAIKRKINISEYAYYLDKYTPDYPEEAKNMAKICMIRSFQEIPKRMQYWAASEEFGGTIRNVKNHVLTLKHFYRWEELTKREHRDLFFQPQQEPIINEELSQTSEAEYKCTGVAKMH